MRISRVRLLPALCLLAACWIGPGFGLQEEMPPPAKPLPLGESLQRAFQLIGEGQFRQAREELERAQALAGGPCGECLLGWAHVHASEKEWDRAAAAAQQAIPLLKSPGVLARAYNQLGTALVQSQGDRGLAEAEKALRQAVDLGGAWGTLARYNLAELLLKGERWNEAAEAARAYLKEAGPDGMALKPARVVLCQTRSHLPDDVPPEERESDEPRRVGDEVSRPEIIYQVKPVYTEKARKARTNGTAIIEAIIDTEGCVRNTRLLQDLHNGLGEAAVAAVRGWVFSPARLEGRPVKVYYVLTVNFQIEVGPPRLP
ncbi:MAG TPA: energy transducer TonB [Thermoanaerobaculia bacterium]